MVLVGNRFFSNLLAGGVLIQRSEIPQVAEVDLNEGRTGCTPIDMATVNRTYRTCLTTYLRSNKMMRFYQRYKWLPLQLLLATEASLGCQAFFNRAI